MDAKTSATAGPRAAELSGAPAAAAPSKQIWFDGRLVPADQARVSVYDHGLLYGDGVFEGIRAYRGRVLKSLTHLKRLFESARAIALAIPYTLDQLDAAIRQTLAANAIESGYIRLCVTRGVGPLGLNPYQCSSPTAFVIADSIQLYPAELYNTGMEIVTASTIRNHPAALSPRIKSMNYLNNILAKIEGVRAGVPEALMLNTQGFVAECTGDNIFIVKDGVLYTPPLHAGVLEGVTRNLVIDLARGIGLDVRTPDLTRHDLYVADECFLTGTAAEVIPVTKIDNRPIAAGKPGPITAKLIAAFRKLVENAPED